MSSRGSDSAAPSEVVCSFISASAASRTASRIAYSASPSDMSGPGAATGMGVL